MASVMLDNLTGEQGYSHMAVAVCDQADPSHPTAIDGSFKGDEGGKKVVREVTIAKEWPHTLYARVPLTSLGGFAPSCEEFTRKARELVGVPYSLWRVRHFLSEPLQAMLQDSSPTGVFCTDVVAHCIDWRLVDYIVKFTLATHPDNQAMAGTGADGKPFFTPNALALALGLLPGKKIQTTGQELSPIFICSDAGS